MEDLQDKKMRICLLVTILLAIAHYILKIRPDDFSYLKIKEEITDQTYQALHEIDPMYTSLVGGAMLDLGDALVTIYVSVPQNVQEFVCWLKQENKNYTHFRHLFVFGYFVDDQKPNLGSKSCKRKCEV